jgi:Holliday junction resolvase RusA-like endonuclease
VAEEAPAWALEGRIRPTVIPDWNNLGGVTDGLNHVAWHDDKQIVQAAVIKEYSTRPRLAISVWPVPLTSATAEAARVAAAPSPSPAIKRVH